MPKVTKADLTPELDMTKKDLQPDIEKDWLIYRWFPRGHRIVVAGSAGSSKTWITLWIAVCIAAGEKVFGLPALQGPVLIVDEDTTTDVLEERLNRYVRYFGYMEYQDLPIYILSHEGIKWHPTSTLLHDTIKAVHPVYISFESYVAMMPGEGLKGCDENSANSGRMAGKELLRAMKHCDSTVSLTAHTTKGFEKLGLSLEEMDDSNVQMQTLVAGSVNLVGQACDTGLYIHKISEKPKPLRFAIITKARRSAIPSGSIKYIEVKEDSYGGDIAWLEQISPLSLSPSDEAKKIFKLMSNGTNFCNNKWHPVKSSKITREATLVGKTELNKGIRELLNHKVILESDVPYSWIMNKIYPYECDPIYLKELIS